MTDSTKGCLLIVDDLPDNLRLLRDTLQGQGYKVRSCITGMMALRAAKAAVTDLILLDIKLPDYDGYEICRRLKADEQTAHIPVIFLSALNETFDKVQGFTVGGADYITKPFQIEEVLARVATHLSIQRLQTSLQEKNLSLIQEIEEHRRTKEALFCEKELAQVTLKSIGDAVITTDAKGYVTYLNPIAEYLTGWAEKEAQGVHLFEVFEIVNEFTKEIVENPIIQALDEVRIVNLAKNTILISRDGTEYPIDDSAAPIQDSNGQVIGAVIVFRDVTEARSLNRQLSWQASHDSLTGLINRLGFEQKLEEALLSAKKENQHHVLCYLDLDQFKVVNDTCGHAAGDELLRQITHLLQQRVRTSDTLARLGGDEFAFLLHQCSLEKATEIAETFRELIEKFRFCWNNKTFSIGVSIGVVEIDKNSKDKNSVLALADAACYAAKGKGRNCVQVYQVDNHELLKQRKERQWVVQINQALEDNRFRLYSQKITPLNSHLKPIYYEILLRLLDDNGQLVSPGNFLPAAERYGLMPAIDRWVISTFLKKYDNYYHQTVNKSDFEQNLYAINLSGASINSEQFLEFLKEQLTNSKIPLKNLCFEITETTAIANFDQAIELINELQQLGCCFAIDDFGHGMNSFDYLKHFPVNYLKIDGSFVRNLVQSEVDQAIVESFNRIGHIMNFQTIAEFVENAAILSKIEAIGLDYAQGYVIAKPVPFEFK
ncbi:response regulator receiver modulated diguanylate cyclase/phosphodiesterase with PAS/PAC sensor(s) [Rippkaea orientalis PCC 8801]|uniref:Response regulator receiver modulated diguanylate cyclase/phosphodiesterase with PAS/PAC sensor(S) n=1 Tax=Rippkaea orientalis (strain PCC 8801 / RF-1) TaxID=41431 RepID=B7K4E7_RIPO1|nr:EAL domain-containing protein [Rippkaea orientalis]ACK65412.1 response regulator receiver modulated diguanylate cyclase/phosphodiesterase with PAS/PAC sensor(s) [Rippkaea orientalis PCC 8801]